MTWYYATSVSVSNGGTVVSVNTGDDLALAQAAGGLIVGTQPAVEIKRTFLDGSNNKKIELLRPWPYGAQTNQPAVAFPTDGDLAAATAVLKQLIDGFTLATQVQMQEATDNVNPASALRVKQALDFHRPMQSAPSDLTLGRGMAVGAFGLGGSVVTIANLDTPLAANYLFGSGTNVPGLPPGFIDVLGINLRYDNNYQTQIAMDLTGSQMAFRGKQSAGVWKKIYHNANVLGTVGFTGGLNSGAVIERGANSNGEYVKFADGTVKCWNTFTLGGLSVQPAKTGNLDTCFTLDPTLPVAMIAPVLTPGKCAFYAANGNEVHTVLGTITTGNPMFLNLGTSPQVTWPRLDIIGDAVITNAIISWSAVGRWR